MQLPRAVSHIILKVTLNGKKNILLRHLESSGKKRLQESFFLCGSEASNFSSRSHLHSKNWVRSTKTREREHRGLDSNKVGRAVSCLKSRQVHIASVNTNHGPSGSLNEINSHCLGDEREGTRSTDITFDTHDIGSLCNKLDIAGTGDIKTLCNLTRGVTNAFLLVSSQVLGRENKGSITGVDTSILNVLVDSSGNNFTILAYTIHLNLNSSLDEVGNHNRVLLGDLSSFKQKCLELFIGPGDVHGGTTENVGRTDKDGVTNIGSKLKGTFSAGKLTPTRLLDTNIINHVGEFHTVLGIINHIGGSSHNIYTSLVERKGKAVGDLTSNTNNNTLSAILLVNIKDTLSAQFFEVEAVAFIVIR
mmetsp:Transcript_27324/g.38458  ORF Transcript_27324/g.38458 Transcript_27324/m.38458 type:complete len:362 (-) Transcript_27324:1035-2120(-)